MWNYILTNNLNALISIAVFLSAVKVIDYFIFPNIDFMEELKNGNKAVGVFLGLLFMAVAYISKNV